MESNCKDHPHDRGYCIRKCKSCGAADNLMDSKDLCWNCQEEIAKEGAIEAYAERHGYKY